MGLPPGSLIHIGREPIESVHISLIEYDTTSCVSYDRVSVKTCIELLKKPTITWINVRGTHDAQIIAEFGKNLNLHPLMLEDIMNTGQRSKLDDYKSTIFIVLRMLKYSVNYKYMIEDEQISIILGDTFVISFTEDREELFQSVIDRLHVAGSGIRRRGADFLCYCLVDSIVDNYYYILERVDEQIDHLENEMSTGSSKIILQKIQNKKKEITGLKKAIWPLREVINRFLRSESDLVKNSTKAYVQDVYDHTIQIIDSIESFRDISASLLDIYMSTMSQRMNEVMKVLTIVSTLFVPLTFIASIYGMNFKNMPELETQNGYYVILTVMGCIATGMILYFKKKRWL